MSVRFSTALRQASLALLAYLGGLSAVAPRLLQAADPAAASAAPAAKPITVQELALLLHGGYTGDEVLRETAGRPLLEPLDDPAEKTLRAAGADARFLEALRASRHPLTEAEAEAVRQQQAALDARTAQGKAAYVGRVADANKQTLEARLAARKQEALGQLAARLRGKLVSLRGGQLQPGGDDAVADKKLFAFYFAAARSAPCRQFTPGLVKFYQNFAPRHAAFETVFVSMDRNTAEMETDMRQNAMPWPALAFDRRAGETNLVQMGEGELPRLVLLDGAGRVVSDSFVEGKYVGPQHVLDDLAKLAAAGGG